MDSNVDEQDHDNIFTPYFYVLEKPPTWRRGLFLHCKERCLWAHTLEMSNDSHGLEYSVPLGIRSVLKLGCIGIPRSPEYRVAGSGTHPVKDFFKNEVPLMLCTTEGEIAAVVSMAVVSIMIYGCAYRMRERLHRRLMRTLRCLGADKVMLCLAKFRCRLFCCCGPLCKEPACCTKLRHNTVGASRAEKRAAVMRALLMLYRL